MPTTTQTLTSSPTPTLAPSDDTHIPTTVRTSFYLCPTRDGIPIQPTEVGNGSSVVYLQTALSNLDACSTRSFIKYSAQTAACDLSNKLTRALRPTRKKGSGGLLTREEILTDMRKKYIPAYLEMLNRSDRNPEGIRWQLGRVVDAATMEELLVMAKKDKRESEKSAAATGKSCATGLGEYYPLTKAGRVIRS